MANVVAHGQQRDALRGVRRTQDRPLSTSRQLARGPQTEEETRSGGGPGERVLAETRWGDRGWVHRELEMLEWRLCRSPSPCVMAALIRSVPC